MVESETQNSIRMKLFCHSSFSSVPSNNGSIFQPFDLFLSLATDPKRLIDGRYRHRERDRYRGSVGENLNPSKLLAENHFDPDPAKTKPKPNIRRLLPLLNNGDLSINDSVLLLLLLQQKESLEREREHTQGLFCFGVAS